MKTNCKAKISRKETALAVGLMALLVVIDQITKFIVTQCLEFQVSVPAIKGLLNWTYTTNTGGGFSILRGKTAFLLIMTAALMIALMFGYFKGLLQNTFGKISILLVVAGGLGNMIDRIFNNGHVVDFIDISPLFEFPIFNFADCCVSVGGVMFCIYIIFMHQFEEKEKNNEAAEEKCLNAVSENVQAEDETV